MPKKKAKQPVHQHVRVNAYAVMSRAVEDGIAYGYRRAHKHTDTPSEEMIKENIYHGVMEAITEVFNIEDVS